MTINNKTIEISITEREADIITTALHKMYRPIKDEHGYSNTEAAEVRGLRNAFGNLVKRSYMGEDM